MNVLIKEIFDIKNKMMKRTRRIKITGSKGIPIPAKDISESRERIRKAMKSKPKLHPAIIHINITADASDETIKLINKMVERALKLKI